MRIAIQGEPGSYHHMAAVRYFGKDITLVCCKTFADVFDALGNQQADEALVAIENSTAGSVHAVYDLLLKHHFSVTGEVYEPIHHCLIGLPNANVTQITRIYSHYMALPQCSAYLDKYLPKAERIEFSDTAASVTFIRETNDPQAAAIASSLAAELNKLPVLQPNIENNHNNTTRFLVLSPHHDVDAKANKASLVLETPHSSGALWHALGVFAQAKSNLTKLESRPIPSEPWHYQFFIDIETAGTPLHTAIKDLETLGCSVRILGEYRAKTQMA